MPGALAYAEIREGAASRASREAVGLARRIAADLGGETHVVALGPPGTKEAAAQLAGCGADQIHVGESEALALCQPDVAAAAIARLVEAGDYDAVIFAATAQGKDIAPRVGARLGRSVASEVIECRREDGAIVVRRPMYAGKAIATLRFTPGRGRDDDSGQRLCPGRRGCGGGDVESGSRGPRGPGSDDRSGAGGSGTAST